MRGAVHVLEALLPGDPVALALGLALPEVCTADGVMSAGAAVHPAMARAETETRTAAPPHIAVVHPAGINQVPLCLSATSA